MAIKTFTSVGALLVLGAFTGDEPGDVDAETWRQVGSAAWRFDPAGVEAGPEAVTSFLVSPAGYSDFRLTVEFWIEDETNSGVFVRCGEVTAVEDVNPTECYEVNIYDSHPNPSWRTGAIVTLVTPAAHVETLGRWNRLEIRAEGPRLEVLVNDTPTAELGDARVEAGPIALQYAGQGLLRFRKLSIDAPQAPPLPEQPLDDVRQPPAARLDPPGG